MIDGIWSTVGSSNRDYRRFVHYDEVYAIVLGPGVATRWEGQFRADAKASEPVRLEAWQGCALSERVLDALSRWIDDWL